MYLSLLEMTHADQRETVSATVIITRKVNPMIL